MLDVKRMIKRTICRFLLVLPFVLFAVFIFAGYWVPSWAHDWFVPLMVTSTLTSALALKYEIEEHNIDAPVSKKFNFPNGVSFSYPAKYDISEDSFYLKMKRGQELVHGVSLEKASDPHTICFSVDITRNKDELTISDMLYLRQEYHEKIRAITGEKLLLLTKTTVAGKEALLDEHMSVGSFSREMTVLSGDKAVTVIGYVSGVPSISIGGKSRQIEICRAIAQKIENSLKF